MNILPLKCQLSSQALLDESVYSLYQCCHINTMNEQQKQAIYVILNFLVEKIKNSF